MKKYYGIIVGIIFGMMFAGCNHSVSEEINEELKEDVITESKLLKITLSHYPNKIFYEDNEEIDLTGIVLEGEYSANLKKEINDFQIKNIEDNLDGSSTVYISYGNLETNFLIYRYNENLKEVYKAGLPVINIETENNENPTCEKIETPEGCVGNGITNANNVNGSLVISDNEQLLYATGIYDKEKKTGMTIKVRGNSSAYSYKKSYKIKLQKKENLLFDGNTKNKNKEWLLLSCGTGLKNPLGFAMSEYIGFNYTPEYKYVNLILNGNYRGLYLLCESVSRSEGRIDISDTGYILERDAYWWNEDLYFKSESDAISKSFLNFTFKYPDSDDITLSQLNYIKDYVKKAEDSLKDDTYVNYFDSTSFAKWLLVHDVLGTWDSLGSNFYMTKYDNTNNSKLEMATSTLIPASRL